MHKKSSPATRDLKNVMRREKTFSTLAKEEGKGAEERLAKDKKRGYKASAKDDKMEIGIDYKFAAKRGKLVEQAGKKLNLKGKK